MAADHLVIDVEEQIAKRLYDAGFPSEARQAIAHAARLPNNTPLDKLEMNRLVTEAERDRLATPPPR
jgi:hypothetical protein